MLFLLINYIFSTQQLITPFKKGSLLQDDELECIYDRLYSSSINSNSVICLVRCTFSSIKTTSVGGAVVVSLRNRFGMKNYIDNCKFINCKSLSGSAIYFNIETNFMTEIFNSQFDNNSVSSSGGAIYIISKIKSKFQIENCTFNKNSATTSGGSIYFSNISYSFLNCQFNNNKCQRVGGGAMYSSDSSGFIVKCQFANNLLVPTYRSYDFLNGGAILFDNIDASFSECNFSNNTINGLDSSFGGGISLMNASKLSCRKCYFTNNYVLSKNSYSYGGAISIKYYLESNSSPNITIDECLFTNNTAKSQITYGGAIFYEASRKKTYLSLKSSLSFNNVTFINNTAYSYTSSMGGAISIKTTYDYLNITFISSFQNVTYMNNTAYSQSSSSFGGAIWFSSFCSVSSIITKYYFISDNKFNKNVFINNTAYSYSHFAYGGAIAFPNSDIVSYNYFTSDIFFEDSTFTNNTAFSNSTLANGGAAYIAHSYGSFYNCTFKNSIAKTLLKTIMLTGDEPRSLGGAIHFDNSNFYIIECTFINNTGMGESPLHISTGKGGAIYASMSGIQIDKSNFTNNTLVNFGYKFDIDCYIEGGACYFSYSSAYLTDCIFLNNTATLRASVNSVLFSARIYGGAVYWHGTYHIMNCINCVFKDNLVLIPDHIEREFSGAIYLNRGTIDNCTFINNAAYNGGDIRFDQTGSSSLKITNCSFIHNSEKNHQIMSLIHFRGDDKDLPAVVFAENKVAIDISSYLFDGEMEESAAIVKIKFADNCMSPFNKGFYKSGEIEIYNENGSDYVSFESAFDSSCSEYDISHTLPIIVPTKYVKTPTQTRPIISYVSKTITLSTSPTQTRPFIPKTITPSTSPTKTRPFIPKTITPSTSPTKTRPFIPKTITPSRSPTKTRPIISYLPETITPSRTQVPTRSVSAVTKTQTHPVPTITRTKSFVTQTEIVNTIPPTRTMHIIDEDQSSGSKSESREFRMIFILVVCVLAFQIILVLLYIASFIMKCIDRHNRNEMTNPLIDLA